MSGGITADKDVFEVVNSDYVTGVVTVGTTEVEAKVGGSPLTDRKIISIYNDSNSTIYYGPTGVTTTTGQPLLKKQTFSVVLGPDVSLFLIAGSAGNDVIVQEFS